MNIRLVDYKLSTWQNQWNGEMYWHREVLPKIRVCALNNAKSIGIIVDVGPVTNGLCDRRIKEVKEVSVVWLTGGRKGTKTTQSTRSLINYDAYRAAVERYYQSLCANEAEAAKMGT